MQRVISPVWFSVKYVEVHAGLRCLGDSSGDETDGSLIPTGLLIKALSIRQRCAEQILRCAKQFEYRTRPTTIRERIYIYASRKPGPARQFESTRVDPSDLPVGLLVSTVEITECSGKAALDNRLESTSAQAPRPLL